MSASIDWAREIRGTSSIEKAVTPASRRARTPSGSADGVMNPIVTVPGRSRPTSAGSSGRTCSTTSAAPTTASNASAATTSTPAAR